MFEFTIAVIAVMAIAYSLIRSQERKHKVTEEQITARQAMYLNGFMSALYLSGSTEVDGDWLVGSMYRINTLTGAAQRKELIPLLGASKRHFNAAKRGELKVLVEKNVPMVADWKPCAIDDVVDHIVTVANKKLDAAKSNNSNDEPPDWE